MTCPNKDARGLCPMHNLQCGYPDCEVDMYMYTPSTRSPDVSKKAGNLYTSELTRKLQREAQNKVCIDGHLNRALDMVMASNSPDEIFNILGELAGRSIEIALALAGEKN